MNYDISNDTNFKILKSGKKHFSEIVDLFFNAYQKTKPQPYFGYNLSPTPNGIPIRFLMKHKQSVIGSHSIRPILLRIDDELFLGGLSYNTMTHKDYRKSGIFTALARETHKEAQKQNYQFVLGFANSNSIHGYKTNLGHKELKPLNVIQVNNFDHCNSKNAIIRNNWFPNKLDSLKTSFQKKFDDLSIRFEKDIQYIKWRYKQNPEFSYFTCFKKNEYFFIFKEFQHQIQIIDFFVSNEIHYKTIISTVVNFAQKKSKPVIMWISKKHPLLDLAKIDFTSLEPQQKFHITSFNKKITPKMLKLENWHYVMGDSDVF